MTDHDTDRAPPKPRGFASLPCEKLHEIASKGGKAAHALGVAHEFTSDEAKAAGAKGGRASHAKRRQTETHRKASK